MEEEEDKGRTFFLAPRPLFSLSLSFARGSLSASLARITCVEKKEQNSKTLKNSRSNQLKKNNTFSGLASAATLAAAATLPLSALAAESESKKKTMTIPVASLNTFQKGAIRKEFVQRCDKALKDVISADDARVALRLVLHDAGTYDLASKTGGLDGSVVLNKEEASRPENKEFGPYIAKLRKAKEAIDAQARPGQAGVSWADLEVLAARAALRADFRAAKLKRAASKSPDGKANPAAAEAVTPDFPVNVGRVDSGEKAGPAGKLPAVDADAETVRDFFAQLGAKPGRADGPFGPALPLFWQRPAFLLWAASVPEEKAADVEARLAAADPLFAEAKKKYDRDRATFSRTGFEVDLIEAFATLSSTKCGATVDPAAYLYDIQVETVKIS